MSDKISKIISALIISSAVILGMNFVYAWNGPVSIPPNGNAYAPLNTTSSSQTKQGSIWASGFFTTGGGYFGGDVGIGTSAPEARLDVRSGSCYYKFQTDGFFTNCGINTAPPPINLVISSNTANYNIASAAGNPASPRVITLTINSGVTVYSNSTSQAAVDAGNLPTGSALTIVNNGSIIGAGGYGGTGGALSDCAIATAGAAGGNAGNAINLTVSATINNTNGYIFGGGGGGGGGGASYFLCGFGWSGGGGGGGAGNIGGAGGAGGYNYYIYDAGDPGAAGNTTGGAGGPGGYFDAVRYAGDGGSGGGYGMPGNVGGIGAPGAYNASGGVGGSAGKAINLNGNTITWTGGNNGTQVKGSVQ